MKSHPLAEIFPMMNDEEFKSLKADIEANGLIEPIAICENQIVDGRNRYKACKELNIEPTYFEWDSTESVLEYVIAKNLNRRHLTVSQRAILAVELLPKFEAEAKDRQIEAGKRHGRGMDNDNNETIAQGRSVELAGHYLKVASSYIQQAKKIKKHNPDIAKAMKTGVINITQAKDVIKLEDDLARELVDKLNVGEDPDKLITEYRKKAKFIRLGEISANNRELNLTKKYNLIYADPPWQYDNNRSPGAAENHYPTMSQDELLDLPIGEIKEKDCVLFLWTTSPMLADAIRLIEYWGFTLKSTCIWQKSDKFETKFRGFYFRIVHEVLIVAISGSIPPPDVDNRPMSIIHLPAEEHSKKPEQFYRIIEKMYPSLSRVELFARNKRDGWDAWGNQS